jgi:hypothetical protein
MVDGSDTQIWKPKKWKKWKGEKEGTRVRWKNLHSLVRIE